MKVYMDLDTIYKTGVGTSHAAGLQAVFDFGVASVPVVDVVEAVEPATPATPATPAEPQ